MSASSYGGADRHQDLAGLGNDDHPQYAQYQTGTLAVRPVPSRAGRMFLATDTGVLSHDDGTMWRDLVAAGGGSSIAIASPSRVGLVVKGAASQAANLQEWQNNAGTLLSYINKAGSIIASNDPAVPNTNVMVAAAGDAATRPLVAKGAVGQIANLQEWQDSTGAPLLSVRNDGLIVSKSGVGSGSYLLNEGAGGNVAVLRAMAANSVPLCLYGAAGQTANLQEWRTNAGPTVMFLDPTGKLTFTAASSFATAAAAGSNGAPPAQVYGYIVMAANGTTVKVPCYQF